MGYSRWLIPKGNEFRPGATSLAGLVQHLRKDRWIVDASTLASCRFEGPLQAVAAATGGLARKTVDKAFGEGARARVGAGAEPQPWDLSADWLDDPEREDLALVWPVHRKRAASVDHPLAYPLSILPKPNECGECAPYVLELHRSSDYVYPEADDIGELETECPCGEDLAFAWDEDELVPAFARSTGIYASCVECARTFEPAKKTATLIRPFDGARSTVAGGAAYRFALKIESETFVAHPALAFAEALVSLVEDHFGRDFVQFASVSKK